MLSDFLFWLGLLSFICSIMVGLSLLEQESSEQPSFVRNVMFAVGITVVIFIFLLQLGEAEPFQIGNFAIGNIVFLVVSFFFGAVAGLILALTAKGNQRAAVVAGGLAGDTIFLMGKILPYGSFGYPMLHDIPTAINIVVTMLVGGLSYYLLRNWGKSEEKWD